MCKKFLIVFFTIMVSFLIVYAEFDMSKLDTIGQQVLSVLFKFAFLVIIIKLFECIKLAFSGDVKGAVSKAIGYAVSFMLILLLPWLFKLIESAFGVWKV